MGERKVFEDSVVPLPDEPGLTAQGLMVQAAEPEHGKEQMRVLFSLEIPPKDEAELEERVARGEVVPADELQQKYAADPADRKKLVAWLKGQHFDVTEVSPDGTSVYARASVDQIEKSLGVDMVRVTKEGVTYIAAKNAPSLPADVGRSVHAIIGLQPFRQARKQFRMGPHTGNRSSLSVPAGRAADGGRPAPCVPWVFWPSVFWPSKSSQEVSLVPLMPETRSAKSSGFEHCRSASSYAIRFCLKRPISD